jgi:4-hydroxy 2-oxovalerate aldolase
MDTILNQQPVNILDCTLRDGGYYNNWDFEPDVVKRYLHAVQASSIDVIEIGFRSLPKTSFMGPYVYCTDEFLEELDLPSDPTIGVMINCKEFLVDKDSPDTMVKKLFREADDSPIELVRIAINFNRALEAESIACTLKTLGYQVAINLMQAHGKKEEEYSNLAEKITAWNTLDVLYFADSLGNMTPEKVAVVCRSLKKGWEGPLGIHTHNNKNLALINTIAATENGVSWCDATITGMGRGAGNASTESLLMEMNLNGKHVGDATLLQESVEDFTRYKSKYNWGSNIYYHFASNNDIHPTFVQTLLNDVRYQKRQVLDILKNFSSKEMRLLTGQPINPSDYSIDALNAAQTAIFEGQNIPTGTWDATGWLADREVLIVGAGPSVKRYNEGVIKYVEIHKPAVLELNVNRSIPSSLLTASVVSLEARAIFDILQYGKLDHPIILPMTRIGNLIGELIEELDIYDYGLAVETDTFEFLPTGCRLHLPYTACYALAVATQAGAKMINLVGFDGYSAGDPRQEEMNNLFRLYKKNEKSLPITSLTPSSYNVNKGSIYSPAFE